MSSSTVEAREALAVSVQVSEDALLVELADGRTIAAPLAWYPRLTHATVAERASWRLLGGGRGIHWPDLDEDVSVANVLEGRPSGESQTSFKRWLAGRPRQTGRVALEDGDDSSKGDPMDFWQQIRQLEGRQLKTLERGKNFTVDLVSDKYVVVQPEGGIPRLILSQTLKDAANLELGDQTLTLGLLREKFKGNRTLSYV